MAALTVQQIVPAGLEASFQAADPGGDTFPNAGTEFLRVNATGGAVNVTISPQGTAAGQGIKELTVNVGAGTSKDIGPFQATVYNDATGNAIVSYDTVVGVQVAAIRFVSAQTSANVVGAT